MAEARFTKGPMTDVRGAPWDDCKVAFGIEDSEALDAMWYDNERPAWLPAAWTLDAIDNSGARTVIVFRVDGVPRVDEGLAVSKALAALDEAFQKADPSPSSEEG